MNYYKCFSVAKAVSMATEKVVTISTIKGGVGFYIDVDCDTDIKEPFCEAIDSDGISFEIDDEIVNVWESQSESLKKCSWSYDLDVRSVMSTIALELALVNKCVEGLAYHSVNMPFYTGVSLLRNVADVLGCVIPMWCDNLIVTVSRGNNEFYCTKQGDDGEEICEPCLPDMEMTPVDFWDEDKNSFIRGRYNIPYKDKSLIIEMLVERKRVLERAFDSLYSASNEIKDSVNLRPFNVKEG